MRAILFAWRPLAFVGACAVVFLFVPPLFDTDDAYISLHSARTLLTGVDPIYQTPPLTGATSTSYVVLLAALVQLHLPALRVAAALGFTALAFGLLALGRAMGATPLRSVLGDLGVSEWLCAAAQRQRHGNRIGLRHGVFLPFMILVRYDTGLWLPQTMAAKAVWFAEGCRPISVKVPMVWRATLDVLTVQCLWPVGAALVIGWRRPLGRLGALACLVSFAAYALTFPGGLFHNGYRYTYAILLPWVAYGLADVFVLVPDGVVATAAVAAFTLVAASTTPARAIPQPQYGAVAAALWVDAHTPADAVVLVHDAGAISEFAHRRTVDLVGLKTPTSIDANRLVACGAPRDVALGLIARNSEASFLEVTGDWDQLFRLRQGLARDGVRSTLLWSLGRYQVYRLDGAAAH